MLTEYQEQLYRELGMTIQRHFMENDLTPAEVIGIMDLIKSEVREETLMSLCYVEDDGDCEGEY
jgi:hypothetical protein